MSFVFYDTETTGTDTAFDQILQFGAIRTDYELNELERFEIRCRLLPYVVPAPGAMRVTDVTAEQLTDPALPSHYEMVRAIKAKLTEWSPAIFIGHNSLSFDEHLLRQALYKTLHLPYLTNTNGNCRTDSLRMIQAVSYFAPNTLTIPLDERGRQVFKLDRLAPANGFDHSDAHDAMADVEATIHMCRLMAQRLPAYWSGFIRFAQKAAVMDFALEEDMFALTDYYYVRPYSWMVSVLGVNPENGSEMLVFDLSIDPDELAEMDDDALAARLAERPKPVRGMRTNAAPIVLGYEDAPEQLTQRLPELAKLQRRVQRIKGDSALAERLIATLIGTRVPREPSAHVEEQIYDGFIGNEDAAILERFHQLDWPERVPLIGQLTDARLRALGLRLIHSEAPHVMPKAERQQYDEAIARRLMGDGPAPPWLTLNMLLSFAQFEREVTAERIRDKIAASKRKGMWMGGPVPLGYDIIDRKLVINAAEASIVRQIFERYLSLGAIRELKAELDRDGIVSKQRMSRTGNQIGGKPISRGALALILRSPLYIGEVQHKGARFPGEHQAIIDRSLWDAVQERMDQQRVLRRSAKNAREPSPLAGMIFDQDGEPLTPGHASKGPARVRYRYYISQRLVTGRAADHPDAWRLPAEPVERAVRDTLVDLLGDRDHIHGLLPDDCSATAHQQLLGRINVLEDAIRKWSGQALRKLLVEVSARIEICPDSIRLSISRAALAQQLGSVLDDEEPDQRLVCARNLMLRKRGVETKLVLGDVIVDEPDQALIELIANARNWMQRLRDGEVASIRALARELDLDHRHVTRSLPLAYLAPDITRAILDGRQPTELTVTSLKRFDPFPAHWNDQRRQLGFPASA